MLYSQTTEQKPFIIVGSPIDCGFFAVFSSILSTLNLYDKGYYAGIKIDLNRGIYLDSEKGPNWWEYFFEPINLGDQNAPKHNLTADEISILVNQGFLLTRERSFELIQKYIHLKPHIQQELDQFSLNFFNGYFVIGVHHRGTDKKYEAPIVPYIKIVNTINWIIEQVPPHLRMYVRIYVATDEQPFITYISSLYPFQVVYNMFVRSTDGSPLHYSNLYSSNYQKGREALIDCLLLSRCQWIIFPASSAFSMAVVKFNPFIPAIPLVGD